MNIPNKLPIVLAILALVLALYALYTLKGNSFSFSSLLPEAYAVTVNGVSEATFQDYCVANALDQNVLDPALVEMACKNQDAYILSAGVQGLM